MRTISSGATGRLNQNVEPSPGLLLHADLAAEQLDDALADREPETGAADLAGHRGVDAVELREQPLLVFSADAEALVGDRDRHEVAGVLAR